MECLERVYNVSLLNPSDESKFHNEKPLTEMFESFTKVLYLHMGVGGGLIVNKSQVYPVCHKLYNPFVCLFVQNELKLSTCMQESDFTSFLKFAVNWLKFGFISSWLTGTTPPPTK